MLIIRPSTDASFGLSMAGHGPTHITRDTATESSGQGQYISRRSDIQYWRHRSTSAVIRTHRTTTQEAVRYSQRCVYGRSTTTDTTCDTTLLHRSLPAKLSTTLDTSTTSMLAYHLSFISDTRRSAE